MKNLAYIVVGGCLLAMFITGLMMTLGFFGVCHNEGRRAGHSDPGTLITRCVP